MKLFYDDAASTLRIAAAVRKCRNLALAERRATLILQVLSAMYP